ncbi:hypothetical protein CWE12_12970 [Aliidiomarina sedimenti]|uniref:Restriction endonuclease type IV Mrr domain-containing protein n=1 Tax=Aliidiomarina sedimenti TaxID=1933879 RepID=A0ABY0BV81_9GAMM|nr:hypothetical protein [Aliidiomarina sedimenti]RUO28126.1 hypothetical protein CWE12_12970 [Aliidiomarina sedimenti]
MKLNQVLASLNQIEKSKFINCLDKLCSSVERGDERLTERLDKMNRQIKDASGSEITQLFHVIKPHYKEFVREQLEMSGASLALMLNILTRDGNSIARVAWLEQLYSREREATEHLAQNIKALLADNGEHDDFGKEHRLKIFKDCFEVAFTNDLRVNREAKISDDERTILNQLAKHLKISRDEVIAVEHLFEPVRAEANTVDDCLQTLREMGLVFINRKRSEVLIADELVALLNELQGKTLADKHMLRVLRCFSDAELSNILKAYGKRIRGVSRVEKIHTIQQSGIDIRSILATDLFDNDEGLNKRKERLKQLMDDLDMDVDRLGTTLDDRINILIHELQGASEREFVALSASGYKEMFDTLETNFEGVSPDGKSESLTQRIRREFELEDIEDINTERLRALSITPHDVLYLLSNDEVKRVRDVLKLSKRGNPRALVLEAFASANDKLIENFALLACRDLAGLKQAGIDIAESDIGSKFEEAAKTILEELDLNIDEELRKSINTAKDKADIIISISDDDVIIGEAKTFKNGDFAKYSTTSRQVKAYAKRCENQGRRVAQVLIIAPTFSKDFIESAEMDTEVNISLLTADGLKQIHNAYTTKRKPNFSPKLFTKGGLLKAELIAKNL